VITPVPLVAWIAAAGFLLLSAGILARTLKTSAPPRRGLLITLALGGAAVRVLLWWFSIGSNDTLIRRSHALHILAGGLANTYQSYQSFPQFNHPPLIGLYAAQAWVSAGGNLLTFAHLVKLPGLAGEAITMWALWRYASPTAFAVYAWLPGPILVSSFHGNDDCLYGALVLVAAIAFDKENYFLSGFLWSAALDVKILPLILIPLMLLGAPSWKALVRLAAGFAIGMTPFIPPALTAGTAMYQNMIVYNSRPENWGIIGLLRGIIALLDRSVSSPAAAGMATAFGNWWLAEGRYVILLAIVVVAVLSKFHRKIPMTEQAALGAALFLVLTPGFAVQYIALVTPVLCLVDLKEGAWWGWTSGLFVGAVYCMFMVSWMPLQSTLQGFYPFPANALGMMAWVVLAHFVSNHVCSAWKPLRDAEKRPLPRPYTEGRSVL
jgi:hypothetical protein